MQCMTQVVALTRWAALHFPHSKEPTYQQHMVLISANNECATHTVSHPCQMNYLCAFTVNCVKIEGEWAVLATLLQHFPREGCSNCSSKACRFPELHKIKPFRQERWEGRWAAGKRGRWEGIDGWMEGLGDWLIRHLQHAFPHTRLPQGALHILMYEHVLPHTC